MLLDVVQRPQAPGAWPGLYANSLPSDGFAGERAVKRASTRPCTIPGATHPAQRPPLLARAPPPPPRSPATAPPSRPGPSTLLLTSQWGAVNAVVAVDASPRPDGSEAAPVPITSVDAAAPDAASWALLAVAGGVALASRAGPDCPTELYAAQLPASAGRGAGAGGKGRCGGVACGGVLGRGGAGWGHVGRDGAGAVEEWGGVCVLRRA